MLERTRFRMGVVGAFLTLLSGTAHAAIDLDAGAATPVDTVIVSNETFTDTAAATQTVGGQTFHKINLSATSTVLRVDGKIDVLGRAGRQLFIRHDLTNMVFSQAATATADATTGTVRIPDADNDGNVDSPGLTLTLERGGTVGADHVVYSAPAGAVVDRDAVVSAYLHDVLAILPNTRGDVAMSVHLGLGSASRGATGLSAKSKTAVTTATSLTTTVPTSAPVTASVASGFTQLSALGRTGANLPQPIGSVVVGLGPTMGIHVKAADGETVQDVSDVIIPARSSMKFSGQFSIGAFALSSDGCGTTLARSLVLSPSETEATASSVEAGTRTLCITVPATNNTPIPAGTYSAEVDYAPLANAAFPPADLAETVIGRIRRSGVEVQIPFLTTAPEYEQHVIIVNRSANPVDYTFTFTPFGDDVTVTPGGMSEGRVPARTQMVMLATDVVSLAGGLEMAASLSVVASAGGIDVMTQQVNVETGDTDTVHYEPLEN